MEIKTARELKNEVEGNAKKEKFEEMISIQQKFIEDNMKNGYSSVVWIFSDKDYYHSDLEKTWFYEFASKAQALFEEKGYKVQWSIICW